MAIFDYSGFDKAGARVSGQIDADSETQARQLLKGQGLLLKSIKAHKRQESSSLFGSSKIGLADIEFLTAELSVLLDSGLKIDKGIELLKNSSKSVALSGVLEKISKEMRSGKQLSQALAQFSDVFDPLYINLVSIGEATGKLADVFKELAKDLAFRKELQQKVSQALTYPMVILAVCIASVFFIFNYVVPNMASLFAGRSDLPFYTSLLLGAADWVQKYQLYLLVAVIAFGFSIAALRKDAGFQRNWQRLALRLPLIATAVILVERIRFNSGLAMMLKADVAIDHALELASGNIRNLQIRQEVIIAINKIKRGEMLSAALRETRLYPDFFASLLAVGEESGELGRIFNEIAQRSQREFSSWVTRMTSLLEPLLIIVMGGLVGGVVVIMMLSITSVSDTGF
jgi:type II secretory pathway component PulF